MIFTLTLHNREQIILQGEGSSLNQENIFFRMRRLFIFVVAKQLKLIR